MNMDTVGPISNIALTRHELLIINNALNNMADGIALEEFETRLGASLGDVRSLLQKLRQALEGGCV